MINKVELKSWFTEPTPAGVSGAAKRLRIRQAGWSFAETILDDTPESADQSAAIRKVREAVWTAIGALECKGK